MQTFKIQIQKKWLEAIRYIIGIKHLNIKIYSIEPLPGSIPGGEPDTEVQLQLLSEDPAEVFFLGFYAAQERLSITLH